MHLVAIVITRDLQGSGTSAVYRALMFTQELQRAGDDVALVFEGAASTAVAELLEPGHRMHALLLDVRRSLRGVCRHCAKAYGVLDTLAAADVPLLADDRGHASLRVLLAEGRQFITF